MTNLVAECLKKLADQVCDIRTEILFGESFDIIGDLEGVQAAHVIVAISLLEQAKQNLIIASLCQEN
jgi:hypothetical protein